MCVVCVVRVMCVWGVMWCVTCVVRAMCPMLATHEFSAAETTAAGAVGAEYRKRI